MKGPHDGHWRDGECSQPHGRIAFQTGGGGPGDGQLLERFLDRPDDSAFEELLRRHGPMVLGVCRRILGPGPDAEDAFQATFLVLVRKAASVKPRDMVGNWLHGVAQRTALEARARAARRRARELPMDPLPEPETPPEKIWHELQPLLDREVGRLPEKYRAPVVLCDLEGKTQKEAARQLGWPEGTVSGRLFRARSLLAKRLRHHGLTLSAGSLAVLLTKSTAAASVPAILTQSTLTGRDFARGGTSRSNRGNHLGPGRCSNRRSVKNHVALSNQAHRRRRPDRWHRRQRGRRPHSRSDDRYRTHGRWYRGVRSGIRAARTAAQRGSGEGRRPKGQR